MLTLLFLLENVSDSNNIFETWVDYLHDFTLNLHSTTCLDIVRHNEDINVNSLKRKTPALKTPAHVTGFQ